MCLSDIQLRNNVKILGKADAPILMLAHGFGCDQNMWRFMLPALLENYQIILFDYVGSGNSVLAHYSTKKYGKLEGYAQDIVDIIDDMSLENVTIVAHSVSTTIASIASLQRPEIIKKIVMVCPSPCFLNRPPDYKGGFELSDVEELLSLMDKNYIGWADYFAPLVMGYSNLPELIGELSGSFCSTDPIVAKTFARTTFFSDYRHILPNLTCNVLILQSRSDNLADVEVGRYMLDNISGSQMAVVDAEGHCLHMTHFHEISPLILAFLE